MYWSAQLWLICYTQTSVAATHKVACKRRQPFFGSQQKTVHEVRKYTNLSFLSKEVAFPASKNAILYLYGTRCKINQKAVERTSLKLMWVLLNSLMKSFVLIKRNNCIDKIRRAPKHKISTERQHRATTKPEARHELSAWFSQPACCT